MVRPLMPILEYYADYDYITKELCENKDKPYLKCNGTCYLQKQVNKVDPLGQDKKPVSTVLINFKDYPLSTLDFFKHEFHFDYTLQNNQTFDSSISLDISPYLKGIFRPPISAV